MATESLGMPRVIVAFKRAAEEAARSGVGGVVALVVGDTSATELKILKFGPRDDLTKTTLSPKNIGYIKQALSGGAKQVQVVVRPEDATDWQAALDALMTLKFAVCAFPDAAVTDNTALIAWAKEMAAAPRMSSMVVLAHADDANLPWVVNVTTDDIVIDGETDKLSATEYVARIAGVIVGVPLTRAVTFLPLPEVVDVPKLTQEQANEKIGKGELILYHDGVKVKIARGVTSFTKPDNNKEYGPDWRKIKAVLALAMIRETILRTVEDEYIGAVTNSSINRKMLLSEINDYLASLETQGVLQPGVNRVEFNVAAMRAHFKQLLPNKDIDAMSDAEVLEINEGDRVFLHGSIRPMDCIENMDLDLTV